MTLKNAKAKGSRNERRSRDLLESMGYKVTKAGGSLGVWDLVGIGGTHIVLVQVKTNANPSKEEMQTMRNFRAPSVCRKVIHRWDDRRLGPIWTEIA